MGETREMKKEVRNSYIKLHIAILLFGFTAILGKLISLEEIALVWWRLLFTCASLLLFRTVWKNLPKLSTKTILRMMLVGVVVSVHWVTFFGSIKYSNVSICLVAMATGSFFTSLIEPFVMKYKHKWYEMLLGLIVIPGMFLVVKFTPPDMVLGIYLGLVSAFLAAVFSIMNKKLLDENPDTDTLSMTFIELGSGLLFLSIVFPLYTRLMPGAENMPFLPQGYSDIFYLLILALACTTLAYVFALNALKHLTAFASNLAVNLEPVYGIILAWIIFKENEEVGPTFYYGVVIILLAVSLHPLLKRIFDKEEEMEETVEEKILDA